MEIVVLTVPDCPHAPLLEEHLSRAMADVGLDGPIVRRTVNSAEDARLRGMRGSPTLLVDGVDPFAVAGMPVSVSCRVQKVPSVAALRQVLRRKSASGDPIPGQQVTVHASSTT
ncbi:hypothetical protein [Nonomuraea endophytica]|uniref:Thioredoxin family protein n=1 Tax=Nonomuraea endophytica TaxID=714136 RepID=A0A7W8A3S9_9ACTN|nr:hypothetical protein [Nonomuraea endophytica]MBB5078989.1 hypothetical protein [Nonomuraea endophytica]